MLLTFTQKMKEMYISRERERVLHTYLIGACQPSLFFGRLALPTEINILSEEIRKDVFLPT